MTFSCLFIFLFSSFNQSILKRILIRNKYLPRVKRHFDFFFSYILIFFFFLNSKFKYGLEKEERGGILNEVFSTKSSTSWAKRIFPLHQSLAVAVTECNLVVEKMAVFCLVSTQSGLNACVHLIPWLSWQNALRKHSARLGVFYLLSNSYFRQTPPGKLP